jgi:hypothetical protein
VVPFDRLKKKVNDSALFTVISLRRNEFEMRKKVLFTGVLLFTFSVQLLHAQCSICTKTASQLGDGPASALNSAILYMAFAPFAIMGYIGWRWWKNEKEINRK